jgi:hypothetical protein
MNQILSIAVVTLTMMFLASCSRTSEIDNASSTPTTTLTTSPRAEFKQFANGWGCALSALKDYDVGIDHTDRHSGKASAYSKSKDSAREESSGYFTQQIKADEYRGKRVRLSGYVKGEKIEGWAGLWMRVDGGLDDNNVLSFDNMGNRPIKGTTDWKRYEVVLDVPANSVQILFGLVRGGKGQIWVDDLKFEVVDQSVASTNMPPSDEDKKELEEYRRTHKDEVERMIQANKEVFKTRPLQPVNLDFET